MTICKRLEDFLLGWFIKIEKKAKQINYAYYLNKSCPLPRNWEAEKLKIEGMKKDDAYLYLFQQFCPHKAVSTFMYEIIYNLFPKEFLGNKNMKQLNKSISIIRAEAIYKHE
jgi:hypothetical protein